MSGKQFYFCQNSEIAFILYAIIAYIESELLKEVNKMIAKEIENKISGGSLIRKMFDEGTRLKKIYGEDKVFDFSIGNPDLEPPKEVKDALIELANADIPKSDRRQAFRRERSYHRDRFHLHDMRRCIRYE